MAENHFVFSESELDAMDFDELDAIDVEDLRDLAEAIQRMVNQEAPWTPLPTWLARVWQQESPDVALDVEFPTVYEENRSEVIRDVSAAEAAGYISHRRGAEMVAKELGIEQYDYEEEQRRIKAEKAAGIGPGALGGGDELAKSLGLGGREKPGNGGPPAVPSTAVPSSPRQRAPGARPEPPAVPSRPVAPGPPAPVQAAVSGREPKRADLSHAEVRGFRRDMRTVETLTRHLRVALGRAKHVQEAWRAMSEVDRAALGTSNDATRKLVESVARLADRLGKVKPPTVTVAPAQITLRPHIEVKAPTPTPTRYERDTQGAIIRSVPETT